MIQNNKMQPFPATAQSMEKISQNKVSRLNDLIASLIIFPDNFALQVCFAFISTM